MPRENTPDLLGSMFQPEDESDADDTKPRERAEPDQSPRQSSRASRSSRRKTRRRQAAPPTSPMDEPVQVTYYISRDTASRLHSAKGMLLMLTQLEKRDVSFSRIVESSLRYMLDDLEQYGERSELVTLLREIAEE